jgi:Protein of unknown function (DUF1553)/Protein of unknown function (DUF1549)/Planctomycete cytochrome C
MQSVSIHIQWIVWMIAIQFSWLPMANAADDLDFFESRIRPLLIEHCYECHGEKKQEGGLRLDWRDGWQVGGDSGPAIIPRDIEKSRLIQAIRYNDLDLQMPPSSKLGDRQIADLETWVRQGAADPRDSLPTEGPKKQELWALRPLSYPLTPDIPDNAWSQQPLDLFILQGLRLAGLEPSPQANRWTLIRRLSYGLTGLPPTMADVVAFENDTSPDAYLRLVNRLLDSPHYGEQWARHWLDIARYSDTKGYVYAREEKRWVHASAYRDWVVRAFNDDMPYDRFISLQLAADQIVPADSPDLAAMGFLTLGRRFLGVTHDIIDDRIDVVGRGLLGLTVACARCHDHKYDPISIRDYYSLYGVFQSSAEQVSRFGQANDEAFQAELAKRESALKLAMKTRREQHSGRARTAIDRYLLAQLELELYPEEVFSQILEDNDLNPVVVRKWQAFLAKDKLTEQPIFADWHQAMDAKDRDRLKMIAADYVKQFSDVDARWKELLKAESTVDAFPDAKDERLRQVLYGPNSPCEIPDEHIANIEMYFTNAAVVELWKLQGEVDRWLLDGPEETGAATILVDRATPVTPRVFLRGNPLNKGEPVQRRFLRLLGGQDNQPFATGSGRLELANAIAQAENPLTARVIVNRVWMHHFGQGLVATPSDFGSRSNPPSHPELLDWLTSRFIQSGWSLKELHRILVLSKTYQQDSQDHARSASFALAQQTDPSNRLLWRMAPHRLSFEEVRDSWLAATGELNRKVGGRPMGLFDAANARRTLYSFVDRESLAPVLRDFDFANPDLLIPQRNETIVPQQALFAMNHNFVSQRARQMEKRIVEPDNKAFIQKLYADALQRAPTEDELRLAFDFIESSASTTTDRAATPSAWSYGYGEFDESKGRIVNFSPLPHFKNGAWQGGDTFPDSSLGWVQLTAKGGHPGNDRKHAIVRRWTAPQGGEYMIDSKLTHEPEVGDGIRAFISHTRLGLLRSAVIHHNTEPLDVQSIVVSQGESIDFVVDLRDGLNSDQFLWSPTIKASALTTTPAGSPRTPQQWNAEKDFAGPRSVQLDRRQQLVQVLMLANEFMFVD